MTEQASKDSRGMQAYRWWMSVGLAATTTLAGLILSTVQKTADDVTALKVGFSTLSANQLHQSTRIDAIERRNDQQDEKIGDLQRQVWRMTPGVPPSAAEEQQRQQWQRR
ncbi:hypothetical protein [Reyranella massiliensis]|uniref:hypothetical protein n=1 Tax=Reyranella massiliensis TaxID=445220 RepID=UPI0005C28B05|nr:hypothetical protein [Reyranella massiliensis]